ncbi:MAG: response regulator transcription factor [Chitinophagaceae bacterium]|nr:response regulator transcription factor [Chitinophagaceae bacterium]
MNNHKILIIEPDTDFRESLKILMNYSYEFEVAGSFKKLSEVNISPQTTPDIILAALNKTSDTARLKRHFPSVPLVVITADNTNETLVETLSQGAAHCIFKGSEPALYLSTLKDVLSNSIKIPDSVVKDILATATTLSEAALNGNNSLTSREKEILKLLAKGATYQLISAKLFISLETVKRHCHNIYKKLGVKNKTEAINKVMRS